MLAIINVRLQGVFSLFFSFKIIVQTSFQCHLSIQGKNRAHLFFIVSQLSTFLFGLSTNLFDSSLDLENTTIPNKSAYKLSILIKSLTFPIPNTSKSSRLLRIILFEILCLGYFSCVPSIGLSKFTLRSKQIQQISVYVQTILKIDLY